MIYRTFGPVFLLLPVSGCLHVSRLTETIATNAFLFGDTHAGFGANLLLESCRLCMLLAAEETLTWDQKLTAWVCFGIPVVILLLMLIGGIIAIISDLKGREKLRLADERVEDLVKRYRSPRSMRQSLELAKIYSDHATWCSEAGFHSQAIEPARKAVDCLEEAAAAPDAAAEVRTLLYWALRKWQRLLRKDNPQDSGHKFRQKILIRGVDQRASELIPQLYRDDPTNLEYKWLYALHLKRRRKAGDELLGEPSVKDLVREILSVDPNHYAKHLVERPSIAPTVAPTMSIFGSKPREPGVPSVEGPVVDESERGVFGDDADADREDVDCTVFAPPVASVDDDVLVQVYLHTPDQARMVKEAAEEFDPDAGRRGSTSLATKLKRGSVIDIDFQMRKVGIDDNHQQIIWKGRPESVEFQVTVPADCAGKSLVGTITVSQDSVPIGHLKFKLKVSKTGEPATVEQKDSVPATATRYRLAFISYASRDRVKVLARTQMLKLVGIRFFQDVLELEPGDRWEQKLYEYIDVSDVMFLFWSQAAKDSEWVAREWQYGLEHKPNGYIKPVIIEGPPPVPPPSELAELHFNDRILLIVAHEEALHSSGHDSSVP